MTAKILTARSMKKELYDYDGKGNKIGRKEWPDDLRVNMVYEETDANGITTKKTLTLVEGTVGSDDENYGRVEIGIFDDAGNFDSDPMKTAADPTNVGLIFHGSEKTLDPNGNETVGTAVDFKRELDTTTNPPTATIKNQFATIPALSRPAWICCGKMEALPVLLMSGAMNSTGTS